MSYCCCLARCFYHQGLFNCCFYFCSSLSCFFFFFFSSRRRHTRSVSAFLLNRSSDLVNAANQVVSVGADIAFDADPKFFACLVRFESSSVPTTLPTAYDVYPLDGRHDGGYYTVKDCVTIDVLPRTPGNNVYVGFMV